MESQSKKELMKQFGYHIQKVFEIGNLLGFKNPLDKYKYREIQTASQLDHTVYTGASNGGEKLGADGENQFGKKSEYKSTTLDEKELEKILGKNKRGTKCYLSGVYNGAYKEESIEEYRNIDHYFSAHHKGVVVAIVKVDTEHVCETLLENHRNRAKGATTNCNTVKIAFDESNPLMEVCYKNEEFFGA